jgi:hypothetical protein
MPLEQACKDKLLGFLGYGSDKPAFVFIGGEEGLDGDAMVNLRARCSYFRFPRHDKNIGMPQLAAAYTAAGDVASARSVLAALAPGSVPVWTFAAMMTAALRKPGRCAADGAWRQEWVAEYKSLGTSNGDTLFADLFPLPKPGLDKWPPGYTAEFGYAGFKDYYRRAWPRHGHSDRSRTLANVVSGGDGTGPKYVIECCRGAGNEFWDRFESVLELVESVGLPPVGGRHRWHVIDKNRLEVGLTREGVRIARTGFPWSQHRKSQVTDADVHVLANALKSLRPAP